MRALGQEAYVEDRSDERVLEVGCEGTQTAEPAAQISSGGPQPTRALGVQGRCSTGAGGDRKEVPRQSDGSERSTRAAAGGGGRTGFWRPAVALQPGQAAERSAPRASEPGPSVVRPPSPPRRTSPAATRCTAAAAPPSSPLPVPPPPPPARRPHQARRRWRRAGPGSAS